MKFSPVLSASLAVFATACLAQESSNDLDALVKRAKQQDSPKGMEPECQIADCSNLPDCPENGNSDTYSSNWSRSIVRRQERSLRAVRRHQKPMTPGVDCWNKKWDSKSGDVYSQDGGDMPDMPTGGDVYSQDDMPTGGKDTGKKVDGEKKPDMPMAEKPKQDMPDMPKKEMPDTPKKEMPKGDVYNQGGEEENKDHKKDGKADDDDDDESDSDDEEEEDDDDDESDSESDSDSDEDGEDVYSSGDGSKGWGKGGNKGGESGSRNSAKKGKGKYSCPGCSNGWEKNLCKYSKDGSLIKQYGDLVCKQKTVPKYNGKDRKCYPGPMDKSASLLQGNIANCVDACIASANCTSGKEKKCMDEHKDNDLLGPLISLDILNCLNLNVLSA